MGNTAQDDVNGSHSPPAPRECVADRCTGPTEIVARLGRLIRIRGNARRKRLSWRGALHGARRHAASCGQKPN
eukprot:9833099-Lingulodinium_polyedra.AAC.1